MTLTVEVAPTVMALPAFTFIFEKVTLGAVVPAAWAVGTARAESARAPKTAAAVARMRMCVPSEGEVIVESVDSGDQIHESGGGLYGKSANQPFFVRPLSCPAQTEAPVAWCATGAGPGPLRRGVTSRRRSHPRR
ncbi:hypothetical protein SGPA1_50700 [Streptomyces misionensis JCM 4497]